MPDISTRIAGPDEFWQDESGKWVPVPKDPQGKRRLGWQYDYFSGRWIKPPYTQKKTESLNQYFERLCDPNCTHCEGRGSHGEKNLLYACICIRDLHGKNLPTLMYHAPKERIPRVIITR